MALSREQVAHVAKLARLALTPEELERAREDLSAILEAVATLEALDVEDVPPMTHAIAPPEGTPLRADEPRASLSIEDALANAPATDGSSFCVPRILE